MNNSAIKQRHYALIQAVVVGACAIGLTACASSMATPSAQFGQSVNANNAAQTVDPLASNRDLQTADIDGKRSARAVEDFREADTEAESTRLIIDLAD